MPENEIIPTEQTATVETVVPTPSPEATSEQTEEFNYETSDNVARLREYAKGLKTDLDKYKPSHEFINTKFGNTDTAELASTFYGGYAGDEYDPDKFFETLSQLSPSRAEKLKERLSQADASKLAQSEVEKMFGGKVSPEDVNLFKKWKESGYGLGDGEDIPEALKFDKDGNPKSDEEINFLRDLAKQAKANKTAEQTEAQEKAAKAEEEKQAVIQQNIQTFSTDRLKVLEPELEAYGLNYLDTDTSEQRMEKEMLRTFILDGVAGAFVKDADGSKDYNDALNHIKNGEVLLSRRYEPRIEAKLLSIFRSKPIERLLKAIAPVASTPEVRPEINDSGTSTMDEVVPKGRESTSDLIDRLVREGKLKP